MSTLAKIKKYRESIQSYVKKQNTLPEPVDVFKHLLAGLVTYDSPCLGHFFASIIQTHIVFINQLTLSLKQPDFDYIEAINTYLKSIKLEKNDDFFAVLVAYFSYYKDTCNNLNQHAQLMRQIIIPISFLQKRLVDDCVDILLNEADNKDPQIVMAAIKTLEIISIPIKKNRSVVQKLVQKIRSGNLSLPGPGGRSTHLVVVQACETLSKCAISEKIRVPVINLLCANINHPDHNIRVAVINALAAIVPPVANHEIIIDKLFAHTNNADWAVRKAVFQALVKLGVSSKKIDVWINRLLMDLDSTDLDVCDRTMSYLVTSEIPEKYRERIIEKLLLIADNTKTKNLSRLNPASDEIRKAACFCLGQMTIPDTLRKAVIEKLIARMNDGVSEAFEALKKLHVPDQYLENLTKLLLEKIRVNANDYRTLNLLAVIPIPKVLIQSVLEVLLASFGASSSYIGSLITVFKNPSFPIDENILDLLIQEAVRHEKISALYETLKYITTIPKKMHDKIYQRMLTDIDRSSILLPDICALRIELNTFERTNIIDKILAKLHKCENLYDATHIATALMNICRHGKLNEWIGTLSKLESTAKDNPMALVALHTFWNELKSIQALSLQLPIEVKANISHLKSM